MDPAGLCSMGGRPGARTEKARWDAVGLLGRVGPGCGAGTRSTPTESLEGRTVFCPSWCLWKVVSKSGMEKKKSGMIRTPGYREPKGPSNGWGLQLRTLDS